MAAAFDGHTLLVPVLRTGKLEGLSMKYVLIALPLFMLANDAHAQSGMAMPRPDQLSEGGSYMTVICGLPQRGSRADRRRLFQRQHTADKGIGGVAVFRA